MFSRTGMLGGALVALLLLAAPAAPQDAPGPEDQQLLDEVLAALRQSDAPALAERVDFERRADELFDRGRGAARWSDLDEMDQMLARRDVAQAWVASHPDFNRELSLVSAQQVVDPDAGLGPVPDRRILQAVVRNALEGQQRDLLIMLTPEPRIIDLVLGEPYFAGANPAGPAGLLPLAEFRVEELPEVHWREGTDAAERADVTGLVQLLVDSVPGVEREITLERVHRNPRPGVAALCEALRALDMQAVPDLTREALLDSALRRITGRTSTFVALRPADTTAAAWRSANRAAIAAWVRWQQENGQTFAATPIEHPIDPTVREHRRDKQPLELHGWDAALAKQAEDEAAAAAAAGANPPPDASSPAGGSGAPPALPPLPAPAPGALPPLPTDTSSSPAAPPSAPAPAPDAPDDGHTVDLGSATPATRDVLLPAAADLMVLHEGHEVSGRSLEASLSPGVREALNAWADAAHALDMRVVVTGNPDQIVIGRAPDKLLEQAAGWIDDTWRLLDPVLPLLEGRQQRATVVFLFDEGGSRSAAWHEVLKRLTARGLMFESDAERLQAAPAGFTRRGVPLFLQPTWDITGEGEFQLANEIVHKFAQCLLTERTGEQPACILWGCGEVAELKLFGTVYQLNASGFVATADHFDWPVRTRQYLDKHAHKKGWSLAAMADNSAAAGMPLEPQMVTWAALAYLAAVHPEVLKQMLAELAELHSAAAHADDASFHGDPAATRAVLEARLGPLDPGDISDWLKSHY